MSTTTTYSISSGGGNAALRPNHFHAEDTIDEVMDYLRAEGIGARRRAEVQVALEATGEHAGSSASTFDVGTAAGCARSIWRITRNT
jgi:hypothetical protein